MIQQQEDLKYNLFLPFTDDDNLQLAFLFKEFLQQHQEKTIFKNFGICDVSHVYGTFPKAIWNGGRTLDLQTYYYTAEQIEKRVTYGNNLGVKFHMTFTNSLLQKEHLKNEYCNNILEILNNNKDNGIIVNSDLLETYIKKNYPKLKLTASVTKGNDFNSFKSNLLNDNYDYVVGYCKQNILEFLSTVDEQYWKKAEIFMHKSPCAYCPEMRKHNEVDAYRNLHGIIDPTYPCISNTEYYNKINYTNFNKKEWCVDTQDILKYNVLNFKIQGRGDNSHSKINSYITLIFLPEYQEEMKKEFYDYIDKAYRIF